MCTAVWPIITRKRLAFFWLSVDAISIHKGIQRLEVVTAGFKFHVFCDFAPLDS